MKKRNTLLVTVLFFITAATSFAQTNWNNWAPLDSKDGIDLQYRFGWYESYDGQKNTELQIKAYNTRNKKVMVNFDKIRFSNGTTDYGGNLLYAHQDSYTFTFRTKGSVDRFTGDWTVEYYE
ncbi:hypothetical protein SAMN04488034_10976 [Salinimicrobium catena]|uniref:Uncharacterized protein n=1 Tax=Salinimicrobium catena TaxID=390640 RepID=A0A1H5P6M8_9FLAO|nr:hypothetical protein [Salinimicrobium catena]SDL70422.1 hypothetical protein SAMN04488140_1096 [Salinimicrobium catena]SEF09515.1 hypothetical protein SAMN04488034_10976 [Salinimicrobium catena]